MKIKPKLTTHDIFFRIFYVSVLTGLFLLMQLWMFSYNPEYYPEWLIITFNCLMIAIAGNQISKSYEKNKFLEDQLKPKPIELSNFDTKLIKLCKNHYEDKYPLKGSWFETAKPLFEEIYGYSPDEHLSDYKRVLFEKLFGVALKIAEDEYQRDRMLKDVFYASFSKSISREQEEPILRAISCLFGHIQCSLVINPDGSERFNLNID